MLFRGIYFAIKRVLSLYLQTNQYLIDFRFSLGYLEVFETQFGWLHPEIELRSLVKMGKSQNSMDFQDNQIPISAKSKSRIDIYW